MKHTLNREDERVAVGIALLLVVALNKNKATQ